MARSRSNSSGSSSSNSSGSSNGSKKRSRISKKAAGKFAAASLIGLAQKLVGDDQRERDDSGSGSNGNNGERAHERSSLLERIHQHANGSPKYEGEEPNPKIRATIWGVLTVLVVVGIIVFAGFFQSLPDGFIAWLGGVPSDPMAAALVILNRAPVIDGHIDLPWAVRALAANNVSAVDLYDMPGHVDIPRLRVGKVGGFFWSTYVPCANPEQEGEDFLNATWRVRDTLEQLDVAQLLIRKYPDTFQLSLTSKDVVAAISRGKIASLLGVEGGHQLGNSISVLRQYHALGVRYVTLTHTCHNAFADSGGYLEPITPLHGGLSTLGFALVEEMNRLGVLVDLSHTSDATAEQVLKHSKAPVIWSHSSARAVHDVARNVPDGLLRLVGQGNGQKDAVVMVNFAPQFVADDGEANVAAVADHVDHIASVTGKQHVGIGSDYDGIASTPEGLEDVSKYPALIAELRSRGWSKLELAGLTGANLLRILKGAEDVARALQAAGTEPRYDLYEKRTDLPIQRF